MRHRAVSLRQHGFLVISDYVSVIFTTAIVLLRLLQNFNAVFNKVPIVKLINLRTKNLVGSARKRTPCNVVLPAKSISNISHVRLDRACVIVSRDFDSVATATATILKGSHRKKWPQQCLIWWTENGRPGKWRTKKNSMKMTDLKMGPSCGAWKWRTSDPGVKNTELTIPLPNNKKTHAIISAKVVY